MEIQIAVEAVDRNGFRASCSSPIALSVEAPTRDEAIRELTQSLEKRARNGIELLTIRVPSKENPWLRMAGSLDPNDPVVQEWLQIIEENRRKADEDPDYL